MRLRKKKEAVAVPVQPKPSLASQFRNLDPNDPSQWPLAPQLLFLLAIVAVIAGLAWWFDWKGQQETLEARRAEEQTLRESWRTKKRLAVNLDEYRRQLEEIDRQFGTLLRQLPNKSEMDSLLADINQAGLGRGLSFELFKPGTETIRDFYAELPVQIVVNGDYDALGSFVGDVARLSRIVTMNDVAIEAKEQEPLKYQARIITYRYLDDDELAAQRRAQQARAGAK